MLLYLQGARPEMVVRAKSLCFEDDFKDANDFWAATSKEGLPSKNTVHRVLETFGQLRIRAAGDWETDSSS